MPLREGGEGPVAVFKKEIGRRTKRAKKCTRGKSIKVSYIDKIIRLLSVVIHQKWGGEVTQVSSDGYEREIERERGETI